MPFGRERPPSMLATVQAREPPVGLVEVAI